jgi:hypothetical protein
MSRNEQLAELRKTAERVVVLTLDEARQLPGLLGRIVPTVLSVHGYYAVTVVDEGPQCAERVARGDGRKTLYILRGTV